MPKLLQHHFKNELDAIRLIIENGWGDGDFRGYGGQRPKIQETAMQKVENARLITIKKLR